MTTEMGGWEREFQDIGFLITRELGESAGWNLYEVQHLPYGIYGLAFNQQARQIMVRLTLDSPKHPGREFMLDAMRGMRFSMAPMQELEFQPSIEYEEENTALVFSMRTQVADNEQFAIKLDTLISMMDRALGSFLKVGSAGDSDQ